MLLQLLGLLVLAAPPAAQDATDVAPLTPQEMQDLLARLEPDPDAPWRSIPWRIDLLAAQREALATRRPLFIWAMDGHPLGCT